MSIRFEIGARARRGAVVLAASSLLACGVGPIPASADFDPGAFAAPPAAQRPIARWFWPGGAVDDAELARELSLLERAGFGGVEIQPLSFGLTAEELASDPAVRTVGSATFFAHVRAAVEAATATGLTADVTFGSGWPSGGPFVTASGAERQLLLAPLTVQGPTVVPDPPPKPAVPSWVAAANNILDVVGPFDEDLQLVAVTAAASSGDAKSGISLSSLSQLGAGADALPWSAPAGDWLVGAHWMNRTRHHVVGAAYPGAPDDAQVIDHLDRAGADQLIAGFGAPLYAAMQDATGSVGALFVDSFELIGELPWTASFAARFRQRMGYDLTPYLPLVYRSGGESKYTQIFGDKGALYGPATVGARVREDYEAVRAAAFTDQFLEPVRDFAHAHGAALRLQAHGGYADFLDAYELADIPETEGLYAGGEADFEKLASSAAHVAGRSVVSSETFVSIAPSGPQSLTTEDLYGFAARALAAGVTRVVYHGFPYQRLRADGSRWFPFVGSKHGETSAGPIPITSEFDDAHPSWPDVPALNEYLARLGYVLTRGKPRAEVAWLEAAGGYPDHVTLNASGYLPYEGESALSLALKRAGLGYDRVSRRRLTGAGLRDGRLTVGEADYGALLVTDLAAADPELLTAIDGFAASGLPVIIVGTLPGRASGYRDAVARDAEVAVIAARLAARAVVSDAAHAIEALTTAGATPRIHTADGAPLALSLVERTLSAAAITLLVNESDAEVHQRLHIEHSHARTFLLDPRSGAALSTDATRAQQRTTLTVTVAAHRSLILYETD